MARRNILVLGGTNYFGKHLVNMLLEHGDRVCIATRGNHPYPKSCSYINYDRNNENDELMLKTCWDVIYDQSCYTSNTLNNFKNIIMNCETYILTSSQSVYPEGDLLDEGFYKNKDFNLETYNSKINSYGMEKLKSELIVKTLNKNSVFPRFPVVIGVNDPRQRVQRLMKLILSGDIELPVNNPNFQVIDEYDAAKCLYHLPLKKTHGPINFASQESLCTEDICKFIAKILNVDLKISWSSKYQFSAFDLIKSSSKTLNLAKQRMLGFKLQDAYDVLTNIISPNNFNYAKF